MLQKVRTDRLSGDNVRRQNRFVAIERPDEADVKSKAATARSIPLCTESLERATRNRTVHESKVASRTY
jgi:hypothetical protein